MSFPSPSTFCLRLASDSSVVCVNNLKKFKIPESVDKSKSVSPNTWDITDLLLVSFASNALYIVSAWVSLRLGIDTGTINTVPLGVTSSANTNPLFSSKLSKNFLLFARALSLYISSLFTWNCPFLTTAKVLTLGVSSDIFPLVRLPSTKLWFKVPTDFLTIVVSIDPCFITSLRKAKLILAWRSALLYIAESGSVLFATFANSSEPSCFCKIQSLVLT